MHPDTYRYLFSALIQVFGTLVTVDAVFLVFQYQALLSQKSRALFHLGQLVTMFSDFHQLSRDTVKPQRLDQLDAAARDFEMLPSTTIEERLKKAETKLAADFEKAKMCADGKASEPWTQVGARDLVPRYSRLSGELNHYGSLYRSIQVRLLKMPSHINSIMGAPAGLVILFSVLLIPAGLMPSWLNLTLSVLAILVSLIVLRFLIVKAIQIIE